MMMMLRSWQQMNISSQMINAGLNQSLKLTLIKANYLAQLARLVWTANPRVTQQATPSEMADSVECLHPVEMTALVLLWLEKIGF